MRTQNKCGKFESKSGRVTVTRGRLARHSPSCKTSRSLSTSTFHSFLPHSPLHILFIRLIIDPYPWLLVLVTCSPTLDILLPTHRCHNNTPNSINNAGVTMMQNLTIVTHTAREIQAQHILRPTLPTTTLVNSANSTPAVSITPPSIITLLSSPVPFLLSSYCKFFHDLSCRPPLLVTEVLVYFHSNIALLRNACLIVLTFGHRLRRWLRAFCHISHERGNAAWTNKLCRSLSGLVCRQTNSHILRGD